MRKSRFSEEQIISILAEQERGLATAEVRHKLGGEPGLGNCFPPKPKGMHWRTYRRLRDEDIAAMNRVERALMGYW